MELWDLKASIENVMFRADRVIDVEKLAQVLDCDMQTIEDAIMDYSSDLDAAHRGVQLKRSKQGIRLVGKPQYNHLLGLLIPARAPKKLTQAAEETLAAIALHQPITISQVNEIRNIDSSGIIQNLKNRGLVIRIAKLGPNREKRWKTTDFFLKAHGLKDLSEMRMEGVKERVFPTVYRYVNSPVAFDVVLPVNAPPIQDAEDSAEDSPSTPSSAEKNAMEA